MGWQEVIHVWSQAWIILTWRWVGEEKAGLCLVIPVVSDCESWPAEWRMKESFFFCMSWQENYFLVKNDWGTPFRLFSFWGGRLGVLSVFWIGRVFTAAIWIPCFFNKVNLEMTGSSVYWILDEKDCHWQWLFFGSLGWKERERFSLLLRRERVHFLLKLSWKSLGMPLLIESLDEFVFFCAVKSV